MTVGLEPEILFARRGAAGLVTLNRPRALNALSLPMMRALHGQLDAWEADDAITRVVVRGAGGRAFCAGGDIRQVYDLAKAERHDEVSDFWLTEYRLNAVIRRFPKPYIALIEGYVMGGGVGISLHGSHRVASEQYALAMPEVGIGFFPDVGTTYALPRLPGETGTYLALTGARIGAGDALDLGLATHYAASSDFDAMASRLAEGDDVEDALAAHAAEMPAPGPLADARHVIDEAFSAQSVSGILARLDEAAGHSDFAAEAAAVIRTRSPTSLSIAYEQMRRGAGLDFADAQRLEYRLAVRVADSHDFFEGVRSVLIDKDGRPAWSPADLDAIDPASIAAAFAPLDGPEPKIDPVSKAVTA